jgi:hypothetical protein
MAQMGEPPRLMLLAKNGEASLHFRSASVRFFPWSPCLMFVYLHLVLGPVPAVLTSKQSAIQINVQHALRFPHDHIHNYANSTHHNPRIHNWIPMGRQYATPCLLELPSLSIFHFRTFCTNPIPTGAEVDAQVEALPEGTADLRGKGYCLAVGWRQSYLNWSAIAASSGLGLSESVETAQGWRRRRIVEFYDKEWCGVGDGDVVIDER